MQTFTFILNLLGSLMLFLGLFGYISGVVRYIIRNQPFTLWESNISIFFAGVGLSILLTI
jgi:predicted membrane channel-forming protein YqfA (hemolysin III family)